MKNSWNINSEHIGFLSLQLTGKWQNQIIDMVVETLISWKLIDRKYKILFHLLFLSRFSFTDFNSSLDSRERWEEDILIPLFHLLTKIQLFSFSYASDNVFSVFLTLSRWRYLSSRNNPLNCSVINGLLLDEIYRPQVFSIWLSFKLHFDCWCS